MKIVDLKLKIVDCFIFYNEKEILEYRLRILDKVVDFFVIVESVHTHSGKEKPLTSNEMRDLFTEFKDKIIHIVVEDFEFVYPNIDYSKEQQWVNEKFQRSCIKRGLDKLNLQPEDIIIVSDADEIPNPDLLNRIKNGDFLVNEPYSLEMDFYYYNLNSKHNETWSASKIITFGKFISLNISVNELRHLHFLKISNGGWHLSYFGDAHFIKNKIENFAHQEYNNDYYTNVNTIQKLMNNFKDVYSRNYVPITKISIKDNLNLPPEYEKYLSKYVLDV